MRNPLNRRILRELRSDFGKYSVIFLFMILTIGFVSGDLVASHSMLATYDESYQKYNIENGHFVLKQEADTDLIQKLEKKDVTVEKDYYTEKHYTGSDKKRKTVRIFRDRSRFNKACLLEGRLPAGKNEIVIDRMYAVNNNLSVGSSIKLDHITYTITGYIALSDYSAMFENNTELMFDAINFTIALVADGEFDSIPDKTLTYNYAWFYNNGTPADEAHEKEKSDDLAETLNKSIMEKGGSNALGSYLGLLSEDNDLDQFVPRYLNSALTFAKDDIGGDSTMMIVLLYILIAIMAFIFGVTISHTITKEASVIGTLRASGYSRMELFRQYITTPVLITLAGAIIGNILGYTVFKYIIVDMYYGSYSLLSYTTHWNADAFVRTTIVPILLMLAITSITLYRKLKLSPLQFIRKDLKKGKQTKSLRLPNIGFIHRFRIRIILQNAGSYVTLYFGILLSSVLLLFGLLLSPLLSQVSDMAVQAMPAKYEYMLKSEVKTKNKEAEALAVSSFKTHSNGYLPESVSVYSISQNSRYFKENFPKEGVYISSGYSEKYQLSVGDTVTIKKPYTSILYELEVAGIHEAPTSIDIYMSKDYYCDLFDEEDDYYNAYLSNVPLDDLAPDKIYSTITQADITKMSDQLMVSMGGIFHLVNIFAIALFLLVVYLLTKLILEKNALSISLCKILGYSSSEIGGLYLMATSIMVLLSVLISYGTVTLLLSKLFVVMLKDYNGWIPFRMTPDIYVKAFFLTIAAYSIIALAQMRKIRKVPMTDALKE